MFDKIKTWAENNPRIAQWIREGGLFVLVSNLITIGKTVALIFLPGVFAFLPTIDFGFPNIDAQLFGIPFKWNIIGYGAQQGGLPYFCAYMVAMFLGEVINFFIQRSWVFRSKGNILYQGMWYLLAFVVVTFVVNSINCVWVAVAGHFVPDWLYAIGTTVLNGGISMVVFFAVNKIVFRDGQPQRG
jgi:putative flippase GtrA